jgi:hypothetical protein
MGRTHGVRRAAPAAVLAFGLLLIGATITIGKNFTPWNEATPVAGNVNTAAAEGCPIESFDGLSLYIASNRAGNVGGAGDPNDIWVAHRPSKDAPWGTPTNLGAPVNSAAADFCPTPLPGNRLLFVSTRGGPGTCGGGDMYLGRWNPAHGWTIQHLGCDVDGSGPNFPGGEFGPSLVETAEGTFLYFSSDGYDVGGDQDIYASRMRPDGSFAPATLVAELNTEFHDFMPNVRKDGLEIVLNSNRPGGLGGQDVYTSSRATTAEAWSTPVNVGTNVNTAGNETRASLSWDGTRLHFGRDGDIFVSERLHQPGSP